jgi:hypothetical protein
MKLFQYILAVAVFASCNGGSKPNATDTTHHKTDSNSQVPAKDSEMTEMPDSNKKSEVDSGKAKDDNNTPMAGGKFSGGNASDIKLKVNILSLNSDSAVLPKLLQLDVVSFNYKNEYACILGLPSVTQFGYIAQNLETQFPNLVQNVHQPASAKGQSDLEKQGFDYKTVNYMQMIPVLTQALKEQQAQIELLKAEISILKGKQLD